MSDSNVCEKIEAIENDCNFDFTSSQFPGQELSPNDDPCKNEITDEICEVVISSEIIKEDSNKVSQHNPTKTRTIKRQAKKELLSQGSVSELEGNAIDQSEDEVPATRRSARKYARICKESGEKATEFSPTEESSLELEKQDSLNSDEDMIDMTNTHLKSNKGRKTKGSGAKKTLAIRSKKSAQANPRLKSGKGSLKGRGRRSLFKKIPTKAPTSVARSMTSETAYYHGQCFSKGDIVSVEDLDGGVYYAQIRGFLTDQFCEKSCVITWLMPTRHSPDPNERFDPATYVIGPEEDLPRKLEFFTFVMHAPDDYYYYKRAPYPTDAVPSDQEYVLTRMGPRIRFTNSDGSAVFTQ